MKVLIAHHVEEMWRKSLMKIGGKCLDEFIESIYAHCVENDIDRLIITRFEDFEMGDEHFLFQNAPFQTTVHPYGYGWDQETVLDYEDEDAFTEGGNHSEYVLIEGWMYELNRDEVFLCGCFDGECIEDMEIALTHCEIPFKRIEDLIV